MVTAITTTVKTQTKTPTKIVMTAATMTWLRQAGEGAGGCYRQVADERILPGHRVRHRIRSLSRNRLKDDEHSSGKLLLYLRKTNLENQSLIQGSS